MRHARFFFSAFFMNGFLSRTAVAVPALMARAGPDSPLDPSEVFDDAVLLKVRSVMEQLCTHSWENGTKAQALIEYSYPDYSPFSADFGHPIKSNIPDEIIAIARTTLQNRPTSQSADGSNKGPGPLLQDSSAADPASLGIAVLLASLSSDPNVFQEKIKGVGYGEAAVSQLNFLLSGAKRNEKTGAISHRVKYSQAWADFVSMVPPFIAYYGLVKGLPEHLRQAYEQCAIYRTTLQEDTTKLWRHMEVNTVENKDENGWDLSGRPDIGLWATGNAWAASGMLRVYATILKSKHKDEMGEELQNLALWVQEIVVASTVYIDLNKETGLLHNYINDLATFEDTAGSTLLAATMYRLALLNITTAYIPYANKIYRTIAKDHITGGGYLTGAVHPLHFNLSADQEGTQSPEGQAFMLMMHAAYKDYAASVPKEEPTEDTGGYSQPAVFIGSPSVPQRRGRDVFEDAQT
ncbi:hypothetical protein QFC22_002927 [Naganishia vaughanmartiniae]|uniref:Uncharacterized protein n=1 Tax=Naganishia vaughanmartiniae TaxID=1424756 RepID=A0ACC2X9G4_9TREE|nr:hypothetical protein QFC22_002927 [Naganishia vaughanmartiniae]